MKMDENCGYPYDLVNPHSDLDCNEMFSECSIPCFLRQKLAAKIDPTGQADPSACASRGAVGFPVGFQGEKRPGGLHPKSISIGDWIICLQMIMEYP